jgi:hypothetical protein
VLEALPADHDHANAVIAAVRASRRLCERSRSAPTIDAAGALPSVWMPKRKTDCGGPISSTTAADAPLRTTT